MMSNSIKDKNTVIKKRRENSVHYVDNEKFFAIISEYLKEKKKAVDNNTELPRIPDYVGECILKMATKLSNNPNFVNYQYKDEMICDGIENTFKYLDRFDETISQNPFAYFTQIIWFAFVQRIKKEKKHMYVKYKATQEFLSGIDESISITGYGSEQSTLNMNNFIEDYESKNEILNKTRKKKLKKKKKTVVDFFVD